MHKDIVKFLIIFELFLFAFLNVNAQPLEYPYAVSAEQNYETVNNAPNNNQSNMIILPNNKFEKTYIYSDQQIKRENSLRTDDKKNQ